MSIFYVKNGGSDPADGLSDENAWETINQINTSSFNAGDSVLLKCGSEWSDAIEVTWGGSDGSPITFGQYDSGAKPIINGANPITGWAVEYLSTNKVVNPGFESAGGGGADVFTSWTEGTAGTSAVVKNTADQRSGSNCCELAVDASNSTCQVVQDTMTLGAGVRAKFSFYYNQSAAGKTFAWLLYDSSSTVYLKSDGTWNTGSYANVLPVQTGGYAQVSIEFTTHASYTNYKLMLRRASAASSSGYFDDVAVNLQNGQIFSANVTNTPKVVVEDDTVLPWIEWDTDIATTFAAASAGSWSNNGAVCYVWCSDNADPDTHTMEVANNTGNDVYGIYILNQSYVTIDGIQIQYTTNRGIRNLINAAGDTQSNVVVQNCTIKGAGDVGIDFDSQGDGSAEIGSAMRAYNNNVSYCRRHGIMLGYGTVDSKADYNESSYNGWGGISVATGGDGISSWGSDTTCNPRRNIFEHNNCHHQFVTTTSIEGMGLRFDNNTQDSICRFNLSHDNQGTGITFNGLSGCKYYYNIIYGNGALGGSAFDGGIKFNDAVTLEIYNNVIYGNLNGIGFYNGDQLGVTLKNNLVFENTNQELVGGIETDTGFVSDYNCFYHSGGGTFMKYNGSSYNWADYLTNNDGNDTHSINTDPLCINPATANFTLPANSPCINAGTPVGLTEDYAGKTVGALPDIGAYERICVHCGCGLWLGFNF